MQNSCLKTSAWWSRDSHFVENGYSSLRFPNMVKVNIREHWTRVTRFNPLQVSGEIYHIRPLKHKAGLNFCEIRPKNSCFRNSYFKWQRANSKPATSSHVVIFCLTIIDLLNRFYYSILYTFARANNQLSGELKRDHNPCSNMQKGNGSQIHTGE